MPRVPGFMKNIIYLVNFIIGDSNTEEGKKRRKNSKEDIQNTKANDKDDIEDRRRQYARRPSKSSGSRIYVSSVYIG